MSALGAKADTRSEWFWFDRFREIISVRVMGKERDTFVLDFVARLSDDEWSLVLVEQGPWQNPLEQELGRIQSNLYECLDAARDGQIAEQFPESKGKAIKIRLDCYDLPEDQIESFFSRFANGVLDTPDYLEASFYNEHIQGVGFEINFDTID